jgi:hypothetical protein
MDEGWRKTQGQSRMDIPETLAALGTQDTGRRSEKTQGQSRMNNPETLGTQETVRMLEKTKGQSRMDNPESVSLDCPFLIALGFSLTFVPCLVFPMLPVSLWIVHS